ncbi:MAG: AsmA family protein [Sterolibacteriaceae bacterium]|uniref:AsmA family protein n=1 Tax=Candidatus Methylophosphatis roskildensis TaxID=2899263 RepID=A0A9D7HKJ5_9PROT|nr:AsmA family protein [Candidatus Methylophosphatis roskildensis]
MKILKYIAFALGGVAALLIAGGLFIYATFDADKLKSELTQIVKEKKQRTLTIDGEVALSFWPSIGVRLGRTRLSEHASDAEFAALDSARVSLAVLPLLSKQVVIDRLELAGVGATLVRGKDGKLNIDDLLSTDDTPDSQSVRFDVASIRFKDGKLTYRDEQSARSVTLSALDLTTGKIGNVARGRMQLDGKLAVDKPAIAADLALAGDYDIDLDNKRFSLGATDIRLKGKVAALSELDLGLTAGKFGFDAGAALLEAEKLKLAATGKLDADTVEVRLEAPKLLADADKASGETINIIARLAGEQRLVDAKLDASGLQVSAKALQIGKLALSFDAKAGSVTAKGSVDSPFSANLQTMLFEMPGFALDIDARAGANSVKGRVQSPLTANLQAMRIDLAKLGGELTVASLQIPVKSLRLPLDGELHADFGKQTASGQLATKFDESALRSKFNIGKFSPLALGFELDVDRINMDKYFPPDATDAKKAAGQADKRIDLSALKGLNATGVVRIGALQASGVKVSNLKLEIKAADGKLDVAPHSASLYEGTLAGSFSADANGNRIVARETLTNVNINPLLRDLADKDLLEGRGNLTLDIATGGASVAAMKRALGGSARVALRDGAVKGINIGKTLREYKAITGASEGAARKAISTEKTDFTEISASFRIANGVAHNEDLSAKSPLLRLGGSGDIDIAGNSIDYLLKATVVNTATGQQGKELANLRGVTVPVRLSGPLDAPAYQVDFAAIATGLAKARLDEAAKELQQKAQDKVRSQVQDKLKGLFGR